MKLFDTANLDERLMKKLSPNEAAWIYNGLDVCVTAEVYNELMEDLATEPPNVRETYETALAKLAPIMEMSMRGTLIDEYARQRSLQELQADLDRVNDHFQRIMREVFDCTINWNSPVQLKGLFYTMIGVKEVKKRNAKGVFAATVNAEALEHLQRYLLARPFALMILTMRSLGKQIAFLKTQIDKDQRIRTSYNLAGTNTGRLASSMSDFGSGTNLQNVDRKLRYPFVADPGMYMVNIDLEQADSRNVGAICWNLFHDADEKEITHFLREAGRLRATQKWAGPVGPEFAGSYLNACESDDLHTTVCHMTWPELDWPEEEKAWKKFCDTLILHGQDSYRQGSKKLGHGTNYYGTPRTMAKHSHVATAIIEDFQERYFTRFPCIPAWHSWTINEIITHGTLTTLFGRRRMFFGRGKDAATHRKAIAYSPQSMTGEEIDRGLLAVWRKFKQVQLLNQVHDSILLQLPFSEATDLIPEVLATMKVELELKGGRKFSVPLEAAGGWNWGYVQYNDAGVPIGNKNGLVKWRGKEERERPNPSQRLSDYLRSAKTG